MGKMCAYRWPVLIIAMVCTLLILSVAPAKAAGPLIFRAGTSDPEASTAPALALGKFCELATKMSNGELKVQAFYQSLGMEQQLAQAVKAGSVDIGAAATSNLARFTDAFLQFDLPYLFKNDKAFIDTLENHPAGKKAIAQFEKDLGVKVLLITSHTYDSEVTGTNLQTRSKPVKVPADIKGLKLRTASTPVEIAIAKAYGANPTPVDYGQLYSALQQGVVDGNMATPITPYASIKLYEVTKYYVAVPFRMNLIPMYINQKKFDSLAPSQQKAILDAAAETKSFAAQWARDKVKDSIQATENAGVHIYHPTKDEMEQWMSIREGVWKQVAEEFKGKVDLGVANDIFKTTHP